MTLYLWYLFIPYGLLLVILLVMAFFNLYHILRFSFSNLTSVVTTFIYLTGILIILIASIIIFWQFNWRLPIEINLPAYA